MHILHVYKDYYPVLGGMENHLRIVAEGLVRRGHAVTVLVSNTYRKTMVERLNGVSVIKAAEWARRASTPLSPAILPLSWRVPADIIHLHHPYPPGDLVYWLRRRRPPLVISYQSDIVRQRRLLQLYRPLLLRTLGAADRILAASPQYIQSSDWLRPHAAKCAVVPLSVDAGRFASPDPAAVAAIKARYGAPLLLFVGRFRHYKGLHFMVEALRSIPAARLLLVGVGPEEARLRALAERLGLAGRIHWAGEIADADLPAYYAAADLFVLPAHLRAEAFGIVQLEALAAGLPIVSTELGTGTSYVNSHNETGLVVRPADPAALAGAINELLADPARRAAFGAAGRRRASEHFSEQRMLDQIEAVYREVARNH
ncbi:MAG TPA: glycosyltransferase [Herpetosiphonaceae bacterium]|nr:glycosyltransferase [Herpetosiphonaceae bacterium]